MTVLHGLHGSHCLLIGSLQHDDDQLLSPVEVTLNGFSKISLWESNILPHLATVVQQAQKAIANVDELEGYAVMVTKVSNSVGGN